MKGKPEGRGTCGTQSRKRPEIFIFRDCIGVQFLDCRYLTFSPSIHCIGLCFKVQKMLPLRLGASSLRVDYDRASRCLQPGFNSNLRKFSFKLRLCSFVYDRLTPAMRGDGDIFVFVFCISSSHLSNVGGWRHLCLCLLYLIVSPQQYGGMERQRKEELLQRLFGRTCALCPTFGAG